MRQQQKESAWYFWDKHLVFFKDNYLPMMDACAYHQPHFFLLRKNGTTKDRKIALKYGDFETTRDYEER